MDDIQLTSEDEACSPECVGCNFDYGHCQCSDDPQVNKLFISFVEHILPNYTKLSSCLICHHRCLLFAFRDGRISYRMKTKQVYWEEAGT
jgi:hypothetical protein